ncbi:uncharacterized protein LOC144713529 [Wolffia australiana]
MRYYLRLMLHHIPSATCYKNLCTVDGFCYNTYQRAAQTCGLLHSNKEFDNDLALASGVASPRQLRELFVMMLLYFDITQPDLLLEKYLDTMSEDIRFTNDALQMTKAIQQEVLNALKSILYHNGYFFTTFPALPQGVKLQVTDTEFGPSQGNDILHAIFPVECLEGMLNEEEREVYDTIFKAIESIECATETKIKAAYHNAILTMTRGIVSASMIIVDEAPMMHCHVYETVDRSIRDVLKSINASLDSVPFGGKVMVMGDDFRQMLPIIPQGSRSMVVSLSLNRSVVWCHSSVFASEPTSAFCPTNKRGASSYLLSEKDTLALMSNFQLRFSVSPLYRS